MILHGHGNAATRKRKQQLLTSKNFSQKPESIMISYKRPEKFVQRYYTPNEVSVHNTLEDLWVSFLGKVYDLTPLCQQYKGKAIKFYSCTFHSYWSLSVYWNWKVKLSTETLHCHGHYSDLALCMHCIGDQMPINAFVQALCNTFVTKMNFA